MDLKHTCMRTDRLHPMDIVINIVNIDFAIEDILAKVFAV